MNIPAPSISRLSHDELVARTLALIEQVKPSEGAGGSIELYETQVILDGYRDDFLVELVTALRGDRSVAEGVTAQVRLGELDEIIREGLHFFKRMDVKNYPKCAALVRSLNQYDVFDQYPNLVIAEEHVQQQCLALMHAAVVLIEETPLGTDPENHLLLFISTELDWAMPVIRDKRLVEMIMEQPDRADEIARIAAKHLNSDPNFILGIMHGIEHALAEGAL